MDFLLYKSTFDAFMGVKQEPNNHELFLYKRAKKYIEKITWVPGIRMIAVVNSLSMYATHRESDIDLFIVTEKNRMWIARVCVTLVFWFHGVWRHNKDIAGNFCLSFWMEESAINMEKIAISDDIYLYFWMYYMKPILLDTGFWQEFLRSNKHYDFSKDAGSYLKFKKGKVKQNLIFRLFIDGLNALIRFFGERKAKKSRQILGNPEGVIIRRDVLKFHNIDMRKTIRDEIFQKVHFTQKNV